MLTQCYGSSKCCKEDSHYGIADEPNKKGVKIKSKAENFIEWFCDKVENGKISFNYWPKEHGRISDCIGKEYKLWKPNEPVFISAQTGSGKSHFVATDLLIDVISNDCKYKEDKKLLMLVNRNVLNIQAKIDSVDILHDITGDPYYDMKKIEELFREKGLKDVYHSIGKYLTICSYHQMDILGKQDFSKFKYVIFDEFHFFTSDADFNRDTYSIMASLIKKCRNSIRVYMSATPEVAFQPVIRHEYSLAKKEGELTIQYYDVERKYDYINTPTFYAPTELDKILLDELDENNKWLVFVENKNRGEALKKNHPSNAQFVYSLDKNDKIEDVKAVNAELKNITSDSCFKANMLIATSVLDNGVNIIDDSVKNVAIEVFDQTEFIQMLGRRRIKEDEKINLFIRDISIRDLKKRLKMAIGMLSDRLMLDTVDGKNEDDFLDSNDNEYFFLDRPDEKTARVSYNINAIYKLIDEVSSLFRIIRYQEPDYQIDFKDSFKDKAKQIYNYYNWNYESADEYKKKRMKFWRKNVLEIFSQSNKDDYLTIENTFQRLLYKEYSFEFCKQLFDNEAKKYDDYIPKMDLSEIWRKPHEDVTFEGRLKNSTKRALVKFGDLRQKTDELLAHIKELMKDEDNLSRNQAAKLLESINVLEKLCSRLDFNIWRLSSKNQIDVRNIQLSWIMKTAGTTNDGAYDVFLRHVINLITYEEFKKNKEKFSEVHNFIQNKDKDYIIICENYNKGKKLSGSTKINIVKFDGKNCPIISVRGNDYLLVSLRDQRKNTWYAFLEKGKIPTDRMEK